MALPDDFQLANQRAKRRRDGLPAAARAHYDRRHDRIVIALRSGVELAFPRKSAQGLERARPTQLDRIEITPSGFGIHFPKLDADLYVPALIEGIFGSKRWMASRLGASGGTSKSPAKVRASRQNGRLGGRPKKAAGRNSR